MRILVAEDDTLTRTLLRRSLSKLGHEVVAAANGKAAWETFRKEPFPLIISDWMMPLVDGLELCRLVRSENLKRYTWITLLTALGGKGSYLEAMKAGADDFLTKPFDAEMLQSRIVVVDRILKLQAEVRQLQRLLPICSYCKRIRDDTGSWIPVEKYVSDRTESTFSHGICSACYESEVKPELVRK